MTIPFEAPEFKKDKFNCPHCGALASQLWREGCCKFAEKDPREPVDKWVKMQPVGKISKVDDGKCHLPVDSLEFAFCSGCNKYSLWKENKMIYPDYSGIEPPNPDLNPEIKADYNEAASIVNKSPRGAVALLRLCIQKLCMQLGQPGENLNKDIGVLVKEGLPLKIQQVLDIVRVVGAEAVHPLTMDLKDNRETAIQLFGLVNFVAYDRITKLKEIEKLYETLPKNKRQGIEDRDKNG